MKFTFDIKGLEEVDNILKQVAPNKAKNLMRTTVHGYVSRIAKLAKQLAPKDTAKDTGTLKKSIKTKREKSSPFKPRSSVFITTGNSAKNDAFYWRFVEYGTRGKTGRAAVPFIRPAVQQMEAKKISIMKEEFGKKLESAIKRELKKARK